MRPGASPPDDDVPTSDVVVAAFRRALRDPGHRAAGGLVGRLVDLLRSNLEQWNLEDEARGSGVDDAAVAEAKRAIDGLNTGRHHIVEEVDVVIDRAITQHTSAPPATESPAMAFDRLSVLVIRIHHTERVAAGADSPDTDRYATRLAVLHRQLAELQQGIDRLIDDVREGTRRFVPYQSLKLYGE